MTFQLFQSAMHSEEVGKGRSGGREEGERKREKEWEGKTREREGKIELKTEQQIWCTPLKGDEAGFQHMTLWGWGGEIIQPITPIKRILDYSWAGLIRCDETRSEAAAVNQGRDEDGLEFG